ncbi:MAG: transglycosylase SLT domain-containing protein [Proteobacteria bacterium]|nr:transglycosylase SLT domain-containing protein [Pseudomonadota bacterium]
MKTNNLGIQIRFLLLVLIMAFSLVSSPVRSDEFEDMKADMTADMEGVQNEMNDFDAYRKEINDEFETYKKIVDQEFTKYRDEVLKYWDKPEMTDKKIFVEYSPDMKSKKVVDFEKGQIEISVITPKGTKDSDIQKDITKKLEDLVTEDSAKAFKRDTFAQNVENRIVKASKNVKTAVVKKVPVITDIVIGTAAPTVKQVEKAVQDLKKDAKITTQPSSKVKGSDVVTVTIKLPKDAVSKKAHSYIEPVKANASKRKIDPSLIFAVMQTESAFNPMARSYVPAYGLMQIVPKSAGLDASKLVFGEEKLLSPSYLYDGENNIVMGSAYLYILNDRYLKSIKNDQSRLYCVIAAYNTGAGNVARAFTGKTNINKAAVKINQMTPDQVYNKLIKQLPHDETKNYVKNVSKRMDLYK